MNKLLTRIEPEKIWHVVDGVKVPGPHKNITGDVSLLRGDVTNLSGNIDDCQLTEMTKVSDLIID